MANGGIIGPCNAVKAAKCVSASQTVVTSSSNFTFTDNEYGQSRPAQVLIVAGGGGGGCAGRNGAGGAGGLRNLPLTIPGAVSKIQPQ